MTWREKTPHHVGEWWHVYPVNDLREHITEGPDCWCHPTPDEEEPNVLIHHAMDEREQYEEGRLKS